MTLQQIKKEAEKEFDEKYHEIVQAWKLDIHICNIEQSLKQFLSSQIDKAVAEVLRSVLNVKEKSYYWCEKEIKVKKAERTEQQWGIRGRRFGWNSCLSEIKAKIKDLGIEI